MAIKTLLFLGLFVLCSVGALFVPLLGVLGYVAHYCIGPERQWWSASIKPWGIRYSYTLAMCTAIGIALNWRSLRYGKRFFVMDRKRLIWFSLRHRGIKASKEINAVRNGRLTTRG